MIAGEVEFLDVWSEAYSSVMRYTRGHEGYWVNHHYSGLPLTQLKCTFQFRQINMKTGELVYASTDSLSSFWSGLQASLCLQPKITY